MSGSPPSLEDVSGLMAARRHLRDALLALQAAACCFGTLGNRPVEGIAREGMGLADDCVIRISDWLAESTDACLRAAHEMGQWHALKGSTGREGRS
jgi:hypothetical protein